MSSVFALTANLSTAQELHVDGLTFDQAGFGYFNPEWIRVASSSPVTAVVGNDAQQFISGDSVRLCPGFTVSTLFGSSGSKFSAWIDNSTLDVSRLEPGPGETIGKYEKVEFGVHIPQLDERITNFLTDQAGIYKVATHNYDLAAKNGLILNPYDPEHISLDVVFYPPSGPNTDGIIRHGFYYEKYNDLVSTNWVKDDLNPYEWRIRYSPDEVGEWNGYINVYVNDVRMEETYFFTFNVVESGNHGYVRVAPNKQYLQYDDGTQFFPVGDNSDFVPPNSGGSPGNCYTLNCQSDTNDHRINRRFRYRYNQYLRMMSDSVNGEGGGNFTRFIMAPWGLEFEWDALGNYHKRQIEMFEMDQLFNHAEEKHVGVMLASNTSVELETDPVSYLPHYSNNWEWNPYNADAHPNDPGNLDSTSNKKYKGIAGLTHHLDFYSNPVAKKIYKNKLRYISARWGYSTSFMVHELMNEIDQAKGYWDTVGHRASVDAWLSEMTGFIKDELKDRQLTTVSYVGEGYRHMQSNGENATIWSDKSLDLISGHYYRPQLDGLRTKAQDTKTIVDYYEKPAMLTENDIDWYGISNTCGPDAMHNTLWSSAFSGSYGAGLLWDMRRYFVNNWHNKPRLDVEKEYRGVRTFFSDVDLKEHFYTSRSTIQSKMISSGSVVNTPFDNLYLVRDDKKFIYGWVHNRSYNHFTDEDGCAYNSSGSIYPQPYDSVYQAIFANHIGPGGTFDPFWMDALSQSLVEGDYQVLFPLASTPNPFHPQPKPSAKFMLEGLTPYASYKINYFHTVNTLSGTAEPAYDNTYIADNTGKIYILDGPPTGGGAPGEEIPADWAYKAECLNCGSGMMLAGTEQLAYQPDLKVSPNPSAGVFRLTGNDLSSVTGLEVTDLFGRIVETRRADFEEMITLDLGAQSDGIYFIRAMVANRMVTYKIIKE